MKNNKSNASSNQSEKKAESNILNNNRHAFEPGIPYSLGLSPGDFLSCSSSSSTTFLPNLEKPFFTSWPTNIAGALIRFSITQYNH